MQSSPTGSADDPTSLFVRWAGGMLRLMGLPARVRCPRATVRRAPGRIELRFAGAGCDEGLDVDLALLGPDEDPESVELQLLAQLDGLGYAVERLPPEPDGDR
jgi:hypothetical protein